MSLQVGHATGNQVAQVRGQLATTEGSGIRSTHRRGGTCDTAASADPLSQMVFNTAPLTHLQGSQLALSGMYTCSIIGPFSHLHCTGSNSAGETNVPVDSDGNQYEWQVCTQSVVHPITQRPNLAVKPHVSLQCHNSELCGAT